MRGLCASAPPPPEAPRVGSTPVYLRWTRVRRRDREDANDGTDAFPPLMKLRWDDASMDEAPFPMDTDSASSTPSTAAGREAHRREHAALFRRVEGVVQREGGAPALSRAVGPGDAVERSIHVCGVKRLRDGVVIECAEPLTAGRDIGGGARSLEVHGEEEEEIYVMTQGWRRGAKGRARGAAFTDPIEDEFRFDDLSVGDGPSTHLLPVIQTHDRAVPTPLHEDSEEDEAEEEDSAVPTFHLRPAKRARLELPDTPSSCGGWGEITEATEVPLADWLREVMPLLPLTDDAARAEAQADLYCYPDHCHDDEYDSNAEDFPGNDYRDDDEDAEEEPLDRDSDDGYSSAVHTQSDADDGDLRPLSVHEGFGGAYGMFHEEGYSEKPLGDGWQSECSDS